MSSSPISHEQVTAGQSRAMYWALRCVVLAMLAVVAVQCLVPISPDLYWDVDPRFEAAQLPAVAFGPAGYAWLSVISVMLATIAMALHVRAGGTVRIGVCVLALCGAAACAYHMPHDIENLRRCGGWIAAMAMAVAAAHLAERDDARRWIIAGLVALLVPWALSALVWVLYEHEMTRQFFDAQREAFMQQRGWEADSAQAQLFDRRVSGREAIGAFGFANVFGSVAVAGTVIALAVAMDLMRARKHWHALLVACVAVLGGVTAVLTFSKGVYAALALGVALVTVLMFWPKFALQSDESGRNSFRRRANFRGQIRGGRVLGVVAIALVTMAFGAVIARGLEGVPDSVEGERSLLFRYQYWQGARRIIAEQPLTGRLLGVGPGGFQDRYQQAKSALGPEDIRSTHSVFVDWITFLGAGGAAWSVLVLVMLTRAARGAATADPQDSETPQQPRSSDLLCALALGVVVLGVELVMKLDTMAEVRYVQWVASLVGFVLVAAVLALPGWVTRRAAAVGLFVAGVMLVMHGQVEMTFYTEGAVAVALLTIATASVRVHAQRTATHRARWIVPGVVLLMAMWMVVFAAVPLTREQSAMAAAADALRAGDVERCDALLRTASDMLSTDPQPYLQRARLTAGRAEAQARAGDADAARESLTQALAVLDRAAEAGVERTSHVRLRAQASLRLAELLDDAALMRQAAAGWARVVKLNPHEPRDHVQWADVLWRVGDYAQAGKAYAQAMETSRLLYLDPARQLDAQTIAHAQSRIKAIDAQRSE